MKEGHGDLGKIGVPRLLHLIYERKDEAAVLDCYKEPVRKRFFFRNGVPVAASSNILSEVLGRLLMQEGIISQQDYENSLEIVLKEKKKHGEVLISMGLITQEVLASFLALQLKRRLFKLFDWEEGSYRYVKTTLPANIPDLPIHPAEIILEGISLGFYPVSRIRSDLKNLLDSKIVFSQKGSRYSVDDFRLNLQEKRFLETLDGQRTLGEALEGSDLLRHRALSITLSLVITGLLKERGAMPEEHFVLEESAEAAAPEGAVDSKLNAELLFMKARTALQKKDFKAAIGILKEITDITPSEGEYWAYLGWAIYNDDPSRLAEAESLIKDSIDLNNDLDAAWYFLGMVCLSKGETGRAKNALTKAVGKNPWNTDALSELKRLELRLASPGEHLEGLSAFGFIEDPFAPVPSRLSLIPSRELPLDTVLRSVRKKAGPVLLEGEAGSGKTELLLELLKRLSADKTLAAFITEPGSREIDLVKEINSELGSPSEATTVKEQLLNLGMRVSQNKIQGGSTLIIIDRAERLSAGCVKLLQYMSRLKTLQLLISAEPSFSERLKSPDFKELDERLSSRVEIGGLTREEAFRLLQGRLSSAPRKTEPDTPVFSISGEEAGVLFEKSGGNPGALLKEASLFLRSSALDYMRTFAESVELEEAFEPEHEEEEGFGADFEIAEEEYSLHVPEPGRAEPAEEAFKGAEPQAGRPAEAEAVKGEAVPPAEISATHPQEAASPGEQAAARKKGPFRFIFWIIILIAAGLAAGSLIGVYWFGKEPEPQEKFTPVAPAGPVEATTAVSGSLDMAPPDGSIK